MRNGLQGKLHLLNLVTEVTLVLDSVDVDVAEAEAEADEVTVAAVMESAVEDAVVEADEEVIEMVTSKFGSPLLNSAALFVRAKSNRLRKSTCLLCPSRSIRLSTTSWATDSRTKS